MKTIHKFFILVLFWPYCFSISLAQVPVLQNTKISDISGSFTGVLDNSDHFGQSVADIGDLDGDGIHDIAVGSIGDDDGGSNKGAVWILFLNSNGTVKSHQKISESSGNLGNILQTGENFGSSICLLGDFDHDSVNDIVVSSPLYGSKGGIRILYLNSNGTVKSNQLIAPGTGNFNASINGDKFGLVVENMGDINGDTIVDLAVSSRENDGNTRAGAAWILFLNANGTVKSYQKISDTQGGFTGVLDYEDYFGIGLANLGDLNGDGINDLASGARCDDDGGTNRGAVWILYLDTNGTVKSHSKINYASLNNTLLNNDWFGTSIANMGDMNGDGVIDLAVGACGYSVANIEGNFWLLYLDTTAAVDSFYKVGENLNGFTGDLDVLDVFGWTISRIADLDSNGAADLIIGARADDDGGTNRGAIWVVYLNNYVIPPSIVTQPVNQTGCLGDTAVFGISTFGSHPDYQWYKDSIIITGANSSMLIITPVSYNDSGSYYCIVSNQLGSDTSNSAILNVLPPPFVSFSSNQDACINFSPFALSGGSPGGGFYSGTAVDSGIFDPSSAGIGMHIITYTYTDANGCSNKAYKFITVFSLPQVSFNTITDVCVNDAPFALSGGSPGGGYYTGTGVTNGIFNPSTAGAGIHTITYTYTDTNFCSNTATHSINVHALPTVGFSILPTLCVNSPSFILAGGSPAGGSYSGNGIYSNLFFPNVAGPGTHILTYTFTDIYGCTNNATQSITVNPLTNVSLNPFYQMCVNDPPLTLSGGSPSGGTYSGPYVSNGIFNPTQSGAGSFDIAYTYIDSNSCINADTQTITVYPNPPVLFNPLNSVCESDQPFALSGGIPGGGIYSGNGVYNNIFFPDSAGSGTHTLSYIYYDTNGCSNTANQTITVYASPTTSLTPFSDVCLDHASFVLSGGLPLGGDYSGLGVNNGIFFPSLAQAGTHNITYTYTDPLGCIGFSVQTITIHDLPVAFAGMDQSICEGSCTLLQAIGGLYYAWNTGPITDTTTVCPLANTIYYVTVTNINGCSDKDSVIITVSPNPSINLGNDTVICEYHSIVLNPGSGFSSYQWSNGSTMPFLVVDYSMGPGTYTVTVTDVNGCKTSDTIEIEFDPCIGIEENEFHSNLQVFPNPGRDEITILVTDIFESTLEITIYNSLGERVFIRKSDQITANNYYSENIDIRQYPKGVYHIELRTKEGILINKFIKN